MQIIKCLVKAMYMELDAAEAYYRKAVEYKDDSPSVSAVYQDVGLQELAHCDKFHQAATSVISKIKASGTEVPAAMEAVWEFEHSRLIEKYDELKYKLTKLSA